MNRFRLTVVVATFLLVGGCDSTPTTDPSADLERPQVDIAEVLTLMLGLREYEIELSFANRVQAPILAAPADLYHYNGEDVRLYGFSTVEDADAAMATVSEDGRAVNGEAIPWSEPVHFYQDERLVILHIGSDALMGLALGDMLGGQIAGD